MKKDKDIRALDVMEEVWIRAWIAVATSANTTQSSIATSWADKCLRDFEERFNK